MSNPAILIVEDEDRTSMAEVQDGWRLRMIQSQGFVLGIADRSGHRKDKGYGYYGWPNYWGGPYMLGVYPDIVRDREKWKKSIHGENAWDPHLRSTNDVSGHDIQAADGEIGHVEDFIIDDETWAIRYLIIETRNWWTGKKVLVSPQWIERVSWSESKVFVNLSRETIKQSPEYTEASLLTRDYETMLHRHYNLQGYWDDKSSPKDHSG